MSQDPPDGAADEGAYAPMAGTNAGEPRRRSRSTAATNCRRTTATRIGALRHAGSLLPRPSWCSARWRSLLCLLLGVAIVTQVRQTKSGDSLDTARPADLLVLLDSLRQREATLNTEVGELQNTLNSLQASGNTDQAAIQNAQARLAALSILVGAVGATGPGVTVTIDDPGPGCHRRRCST